MATINTFGDLSVNERRGSKLKNGMNVTEFADALEKKLGLSSGKANPFVIPSDEEVFRMQEADRIEREKARIANLTKKIWDKTDYNTAMTRTRKVVNEMAPSISIKALKPARTKFGVTVGNRSIKLDKPREKESIRDFIDKKKEMFFVQMSLDIKKKQLEKIDEVAMQRDAKIVSEERRINEKMQELEDLRRQKERAAQDALKKAEEMAKLKSERLHDLKKQKHMIGLEQTEKAKLRELLDEYHSEKAFLDSLTPSEWFAARATEQEELRLSRQKASFEARYAAWQKNRTEQIAALQHKLDVERKEAIKRGHVPVKHNIDQLIEQMCPPAPKLSDEPLPELSEAEKELPLFFESPAHLRALFDAQEDDYFYLIKSTQQLEEQVEELSMRISDLKKDSESRISVLAAQEAALRQQLEREQLLTMSYNIRNIDTTGKNPSKEEVEEESGDSNNPTKTNASNGADNAATNAGDSAGGEVKSSALSVINTLMNDLRQCIHFIFQRCGLSLPPGADTPALLSILESSLEQLLEYFDLHDPALYKKLVRAAEHARRDKIRDARLHAQARAHDERIATMLARVNAPVKKKEGKPVMPRSVIVLPPPSPTELNKEELQELEDAMYLN